MPFFVGYDHHFPAVDRSKAGNDGLVIGKSAVPMQLQKTVKHTRNVVLRSGPVPMPGHADALPGGQIGYQPAEDLLLLLFECGYVFAEIDAVFF